LLHRGCCGDAKHERQVGEQKVGHPCHWHNRGIFYFPLSFSHAFFCSRHFSVWSLRLLPPSHTIDYRGALFLTEMPPKLLKPMAAKKAMTAAATGAFVKPQRQPSSKKNYPGPRRQPTSKMTYPWPRRKPVSKKILAPFFTPVGFSHA
jgi:hypothetical protein